MAFQIQAELECNQLERISSIFYMSFVYYSILDMEMIKDDN